VKFRCRPPATNDRRLTLDDNDLIDSITDDRQRRRRRDDLLLDKGYRLGYISHVDVIEVMTHEHCT
jgi:hypothetical protein